jgi:hypothetical protein
MRGFRNRIFKLIWIADFLKWFNRLTFHLFSNSLNSLPIWIARMRGFRNRIFKLIWIADFLKWFNTTQSGNIPHSGNITLSRHRSHSLHNATHSSNS